MERPALAPQCVQTPPRAARKSEWLRSALAHHHGPDPCADNEIVVLATGVDQYLQEVFHHLAQPSQDDSVSAQDFTALCAVLGLAAAEREDRTTQGGDADGAKGEEDDEFGDACSALPCRLSFKDFHARLCGYFRVRSARGRATGDGAARLPVTEDTELVERQIRLRWPRARRRKCVSFDLARDQNGTVHRSVKGRAAADREPDEVAALRELVEDLRSALQGSDARCLALEVALRRERGRAAPPPSTSFQTPASSPTSSITLEHGKLVPTRRIKGHCSGAGGDAPRRRDIRDPLERELKLIRSSRDGQLEEAMRFNQRLEEELRWAYQEVRKLLGAERALWKENAHIRRRAEEAREALSLGLQRVRMIQEEAQSVPQLQHRVTQLEAELHQYRSQSTCIPDPTRHETHPLGEADACSRTECLQRAVEGRAASDEEEEDRGTRGEAQCCPMEVEKHRPLSWGGGCQNCAAHPAVSEAPPRGRDLASRGPRSWKGHIPEMLQGSRRLEKEEKPEGEEDKTRPEDREKTRVSLLEDKLTDALTLLLHLRNKNVSRRALGRIVMDTLDVCSRSSDGPSQVLQVADALCVQLSSRDLLGNGGEDQGGESRSACERSSANPLLISC